MIEPIRILHVVTSMNLGGIETFLMTLYRNIDRSKFQFDFLYHTQENCMFDAEIKKLGGNIYRVKNMTPFNYFTYCKKLKRLLEDENYQIIHSHLNSKSSIVLCIAKELEIPIRIAHSHTNSSGKGLKGYMKSLLKMRVNKYSTHRFACSEEAGSWLFGKKINFQIIKNAIDINAFSFSKKYRDGIRKHLGIDDDTIVIGNISRFSEEKNHSFIIQVFKEFNSICPNSVLLLIGSGKLMSQIKEKTSDFKLRGKVIFLGKKLNANIYLNAMDIFLLPSKYEGLGIVAIESQVNGLETVISANLPNDLDQSSLVKRLSLSSSSYEWARKIQCYYQKQDVLTRGVHADTFSKSEYNIDITINLLETIYFKSYK